MFFFGDTETDKQFGSGCLHGIAAGIGEKSFDIVGALFFFVGEFEFIVEVLPFLMDLPEFFIAHVDHIENGDIFVVVMVLFQKTDTAVFIHGDRAERWGEFAGQDLHEGGFA